MTSNIENGLQNQIVQYLMMEIDVFKCKFEILCYSKILVQNVVMTLKM